MPKPRHLLFKSFLERFFDPEKHVQLQGHKGEIDANVLTILWYLKEEDSNEGNDALAKVIEEYHSHYEMLYKEYDHITEELKKEADGKRADKDSSSSYDSSDSDGTPKKKRTKNAELTELSEQLATKDIELSYEQESFTTFKESAERDVDDLNQRKHACAAEEENKKLCLKMSELEDEIKHLWDKIQGHVNAMSHLSEQLDEKERAVSAEQGKFVAFRKESEEKLESAEKKIAKLKQVVLDDEQEKKSLSLMISEMQEKAQQGEKKIWDFVAEVERLNENLYKKERALASQLDIHEAHKQEASTCQRDLELEEKKNDVLAVLQKLADIETLKEELEKRDLELGVAVEENESLLSQLKDLKTELDSTRTQKIELDEELKSKNAEISILLFQNATLKEADEKRAAAQQENEENQARKSKELEVMVKKLANQKHEFEEQMRRENEELSQLKDENEKLKDKICQFQKQLIEKENEFSTARKEFEDGDTRSSALITDLIKQVSSLEKELSSKTAAAEIVAKENSILETNVKKLQLEREILQSRIGDLEAELSFKSNKEDELVAEIGLLRNTVSEMKIVLADKVKNIKDVNSQMAILEAKKIQYEELLGKHDQETRQLLTDSRNARDEFSKRITESTEELKAKDVEISKSREAYLKLAHRYQNQKEVLRLSMEKVKEITQSLQSETEAKTGLETQVEELKRHLDMKRAEIISFSEIMQNASVTEEKLREEQKVLSDRLATLMDSTSEPQTKITPEMSHEVSATLSRMDGFIMKFVDAYGQLDSRIIEINQELKRMANRVREINNSRDQKKAHEVILKGQITELENELQKGVGEKTSLLESLQERDEKISEMKKMMKEMEAGYQSLSEKMDRISAYSEARTKIIPEMSDKVSSTLSQMDDFVMKYEEDYGKFDSRIIEINHEVKRMGNWIREMNTNEDQMKAHEEILKGKITELENELQKGVGEKSGLVESLQERDEKIRELENMMKEKEAGYQNLSEQKQEVIRQLCVWIEYHRNRYNHLKKMWLEEVRGGDNNR